MAVSYNLKIVTDFASAHTLRNYPGACSRLHGHNWKVEVEVMANTLNEAGMGIDFKEIKKCTKQVTAELDHRYINEIKPFDEINPTAENIAAYIYKGVGELINNDHVRVTSITLWETERACVRYSESPE
jgi:6-pyruvoyltetrahydropterin/6-carboxytetrahydropterin synthase